MVEAIRRREQAEEARRHKALTRRRGVILDEVRTMNPVSFAMESMRRGVSFR